MKTNAEYWEEFVLNDAPDSYRNWFEKEIEYLKKRIHPNSKTLDIACGTGRITKEIKKSTKDVVGIDHDSEIINKNNQNPELTKISFIRSEASKLPFKDKTFDFVICMGSFHNFGEEKDLILKEMKRVIKDNGKIILDVFSENALSERMKVYKKSRGKFRLEGTTVFFDDGNGDKISEQFTKKELTEIFSKVNLKIEDIIKTEIAYLCTLTFPSTSSPKPQPSSPTSPKPAHY